MIDIILEMQSQYAEGKNELIINNEKYETEDINILGIIFSLFKNIKISPNKDRLKFEGKMINIKINDIEKAKLKKQWQSNMIKKIIGEEKAREFYNINEEQINYELLKELSFINNKESLEIEEENLDEENLKNIVKKFKKIFKDTKVYKENNNLVLWAKSKEIILEQNNINLLKSIVNLLVNYKNINFSILPLYDFNDDENDNIQGINVILNIFYK